MPDLLTPFPAPTVGRSPLPQVVCMCVGVRVCTDVCTHVCTRGDQTSITGVFYHSPTSFLCLIFSFIVCTHACVPVWTHCTSVKVPVEATWWECWEPNPGPLEEQQPGVWTTEAFFQILGCGKFTFKSNQHSSHASRALLSLQEKGCHTGMPRGVWAKRSRWALLSLLLLSHTFCSPRIILLCDSGFYKH